MKNYYTAIKLLLLFLFSLSVLFFSSHLAYAATYGSGSYGSGSYGNGDSPSGGGSSSDGSGSTTTSPGCSNSPPGSAPNLFEVDRSRNTATLFFAPAVPPVNGYVISYGPSQNNQIYGLSTNGGSVGVQKVVISSLSQNQSYVFRVMANNGCATSNWSGFITMGTSARKYYPSLITSVTSNVSYSIANAVSSVKNTLNPFSPKQLPKKPLDKTKSTSKIKPSEQTNNVKPKNIFQKVLSLFGL